MDIRNFINKVRNFNQTKYEEIGANSLMEGIKLNGFSINRNNDPGATTIYLSSDNENEITEDIDFEFDDKGGMIVFSLNVNAVELSKNKIVRSIKNKIETAKNMLFKTSKVNKVIKQNPEIYGVTIGNFVKGRYKAKDGSLYDETSMSIEIIGITSDVLNKVAEELAKEFKQETVLVKNYETGKIYMVK
jgi:hypothetical protein